MKGIRTKGIIFRAGTFVSKGADGKDVSTEIEGGEVELAFKIEGSQVIATFDGQESVPLQIGGNAVQVPIGGGRGEATISIEKRPLTLMVRIGAPHLDFESKVFQFDLPADEQVHSPL